MLQGEIENPSPSVHLVVDMKEDEETRVHLVRHLLQIAIEESLKEHNLWHLQVIKERAEANLAGAVTQALDVPVNDKENIQLEPLKEIAEQKEKSEKILEEKANEILPGAADMSKEEKRKNIESQAREKFEEQVKSRRDLMLQQR